LFAGQTGWSVTLDATPSITVIAGADAQDDCAVLRVQHPVDVVVGTDYVRGSKFYLYERGLLNEFDIAWYLTAANFSDVAAMGAAPVALLSVVRYPLEMPDRAFGRVVDGIAAGCHAVGALNVGGDIGTAERLFLSASALGVVQQGRALLRSGAQPNELVCLTGPTGLAGSALAYFRTTERGAHRLSAEDEAVMLRPWRRARARSAEGRLLGSSGLATACVDTSDGLKGALECLTGRSGIGVEIDAAALPVHPVVKRVAHLTNEPAENLVLGDSVDFQLVFTVAPSNVETLHGRFAAVGLNFVVIGRTTREVGELMLREHDGSLRALPGAAWRHV
jgi:thiamine-monophosphate kinase